ncbi:MAG: von Willebrand factor type A domain-containing protein, partial [Pseudomonadota bacterium]|nr:von Willebrand factor type A domain-containing protein [Pseudomonadota bacterium]
MPNRALVRTLLSLAIGAVIGACSSTETEAPSATATGTSNAASSAAAADGVLVASEPAPVLRDNAVETAREPAYLQEIHVTGSRVMTAANGARIAQQAGAERARVYAPAPSYAPGWSAAAENYGELVDTGAYSNVRRFITNGAMPPSDAVRTEELLNYFDYDYPDTASNAPFSIATEIAPSPWHEGRHLLHIGIEAIEPEAAGDLRSNLVFLVDVSGSMASSDKLPLLVTSLKLLTKQLDVDDSIAIVVYAGASGVVLEPTPGNDTRAITNALERLQAGGSTNGAAGVELAYDLAEKQFIEGGINRVLLATDGDFNVGITDFEALKKLIAAKRKTGIGLTTLGFGTGNYNDRLMEQLADAGNGNYAYIDSINEARKVLVDEAASTLQTVAKDVKIQIEFNPTLVSEYRLIGYENRVLAQEDFNNDRVDAGEIGAGHTVTALYEITLSDSESGHSIDPLRYGSSLAPAPVVQRSPDTELAYLKLRYKEPDSDTSQLL